MHHTFEAATEATARIRSTRKLAELADKLGENATRITGPGSNAALFAFAAAAEAHADASAVPCTCSWRIVDPETGADIVRIDPETGAESIDVFFMPGVTVTMESQRLALRHGNWRLPGWYRIPDAVRPGRLVPVGIDPTTIADVRRARRIAGETIRPNIATFNREERSRIARYWRSHGNRAGTMRFAASALVSARFSGDELAQAVLAAVLQAGSWAILADMPRAKVTVSRRSNPPCNGLADYIGEPFRSFARDVPAALVRDHVARHFVDILPDAVADIVPFNGPRRSCESRPDIRALASLGRSNGGIDHAAAADRMPQHVAARPAWSVCSGVVDPMIRRWRRLAVACRLIRAKAERSAAAASRRLRAQRGW